MLQLVLSSSPGRGDLFGVVSVYRHDTAQSGVCVEHALLVQLLGTVLLQALQAFRSDPRVFSLVSCVCPKGCIWELGWVEARMAHLYLLVENCPTVTYKELQGGTQWEQHS